MTGTCEDRDALHTSGDSSACSLAQLVLRQNRRKSEGAGGLGDFCVSRPLLCSVLTSHTLHCIGPVISFLLLLTATTPQIQGILSARVYEYEIPK